MPIDIRPMQADDAAAVAAIHVRVWQEAYRGQMDQAFLDNMSVADRTIRWQEGYAQRKDDPRYGTLLAFDGQTMAGFLSYGAAREENALFPHEIYAINILAAYTGQGIGRALFTQATRLLKDQGAANTYLWVLSSNDPALQSYRRWGGALREDITKTIEIAGQAHREVAVTFRL